VGGTVAIVGGDVVFTPTASFNSPASFTYTVIDDGNVWCRRPRSTWRSPVKRQPVANPDAASTINTLLASIVVLTNDMLTAAPERQASCKPQRQAHWLHASASSPAVISYSISDGADGTPEQRDGQCGHNAP
jgi:hypothetical protein